MVDASAPVAVSSPVVAPDVVAPTVACTAIDRIDASDAAIGFHVTDLVDVAPAAVNDAAVITFAVDGDHGCDQDGCYEFHQTFAVDVDHAKAGRPYHLKTSATGISPSEVAAPFVLGNDLFVLTKGHRGAAGMLEPGHDPPETEYVLQKNAITKRWPSSDASASVTASVGPTAWALALGGTEPFGPTNVRAYRLDATTRTVSTIETVKAPIDAPAIAASTDRVVIAYRVAARNRLTPPQILAVWLDPTTANAIGTPQVVASGDVGAPTIAIRGDEAHFVWARKKDASFVLMRASWAAADPKPSGAVELASNVNGLAPALAVVGNRFALAWTAGDERGTRGSIFAGFGGTVDEAASAAIVRSASDVKNARDPEWASSGSSALLVWSEHDGPRRIAGAWCR